MKQHKSIMFYLIVILVIFAWIPSLKVKFLADDYEFFHIFPMFQISEIWKLFIPKFIFTEPGVVVRYRPLTAFFFWIDWQIWKYIPFGYHITNLFFHLLTAIPIFFIAKSFWKNISQNESRQVGILTVILFVLNPLAPYAVTWIDGRYDVIAGFCLFTSLALFLLYLKKKKKFFFILSILANLFSLFAKETALVFPLFITTIILYKKLPDFKEIKPYISYLFKDSWIIGKYLFVVIFYLILSTLALGQPIWQAKGYAGLFTISRLFIIWFIITIVWLLTKTVRKQFIITTTSLLWFLIGISLLPIAFLPTEIRFLYIPSGFVSIWLALYLITYLKLFTNNKKLFSFFTIFNIKSSKPKLVKSK